MCSCLQSHQSLLERKFWPYSLELSECVKVYHQLPSFEGSSNMAVCAFHTREKQNPTGVFDPGLLQKDRVPACDH